MHSDGVYVRGLSLRTASTSTTSVSSTINETLALPSVFFNAVFVNPIKRSYQPPYQGARFSMNFHTIPRLPNDSASLLDDSNSLNSSVAERYVEPLSDTIIRGSDFLLANLLRARRKVSVVRSVTISRCTPLVVANVNRQM